MFVTEDTYKTPVSASTAPPGQLAPPTWEGNISVAALPFVSGTIGGVYSGPNLYCEAIWMASARSAGVKSIRSSRLVPWRSNGAGLVGNGWVGEVLSPGTSDCGTGRSTIGQTGSPVTRSNTKVSACLVTCATALIGLPFTVTSTSIGGAGTSKSQMS